MWRLISRQWFLSALVVSLAIGFGLTDVVRPLAELAPLRSSITATVLFLMGLTLNASSVARSVRQPGPVLLAILVNTLVVPLLALPSLWLFSADIAGGLIVTSLVPCTLASAAVWTRKAGGDDAIAMVVSVTTNLACFLVAPLGLWILLGAVTDVSAVDQIASLLAWVVLPLVIGQLFRRFWLAAWVTERQSKLSTLAQCGILVMVCFGSVASADRMASDRSQSAGRSPEATESDEVRESAAASRSTGVRRWFGAGELVAAGGVAILIHCVAFAVAVASARRIGFLPPTQIAVGIAGSQKTLMVGLQIALDCGVSVLPMIIYHVGQLVIDTFIVQNWAARNRESVDGKP